tara:strand:+ start:107 stop:988 length:882 start_codon:yes stop_codon:yes gene_type:complete
MPDIEKYSGVEMADIEKISGQDVPSGGGGTASTAPTLTVTEGAFGEFSVTINNHSSYTNPNFSFNSKIGSTVVAADSAFDRNLETDKSSLSDTSTFIDSNTSNSTRTVTVRAQEFGDSVQSAEATATYTKSGISGRYLRIRGVTSDGSQTSGRIAVYECRFYESYDQSGTIGTNAYPQHMVSATTDSDGSTDYTITAGHTYSQSYAEWKAFNNSSSAFNMYWALGTNAANNWIQLKFDSTAFPTPPSINSMRIGFNSQTGCSHFALEASSDGSTFTQLGIFEITSKNSLLSFP